MNLPHKLSVQIRYNSAPQPATVLRCSDKSFEVGFDTPAEGVAPGQLAVVFDGDRVLGGGWIDRTDSCYRRTLLRASHFRK